MITDAILFFILSTPNNLLDLLPTFSVTIPEGVFDGLSKLFAFVGWFPIAKILPILVCSIALSIGRIVWACIIRVKSFIPTMGD